MFNLPLEAMMSCATNYVVAGVTLNGQILNRFAEYIALVSKSQYKLMKLADSRKRLGPRINVQKARR